MKSNEQILKQISELAPLTRVTFREPSLWNTILRAEKFQIIQV